MIALVLPNEKSSQPLQKFVVTVDHVESITGIDFFSGLEDSIENQLEASSDASLWTFTSHKSTYKTESSNEPTSKQCLGVRCKNKTTNANGHCHVHQGQASGAVKKIETKTTHSGRCQATTQKGTQCKRNASSESRYRWQHQ